MKMNDEDEELSRAEVRKVVPDLTEMEWALLVKEGWTRELASPAAEGAESALLKEIRLKVEDWRSLQNRAKPKPLGGTFSHELVKRAEIISEVVANVAAEDPDVRAFRERYLDGQLLDVANVSAWVTKNRGKASQWIELALPDESELDHGRDGTFGVTPALTISRNQRIRAKVSRRLLSYVIGGELEHEFTTNGGPLEVLRRLSESLERRYGWTPGQGATFALTGATPMLEPIRSRDIIRMPAGPAVRRIVLEIDPAVRAEEVAAAYRTIRDAALGRRPRTLSEKHLRLAAFITGRPDEEPMRESLAAWNAERPEWAYTSPGNFKRDVRAALRRLLNADLAEPKGDVDAS